MTMRTKTTSELSTYRVRVDHAIYQVRARTERMARALACSLYAEDYGCPAGQDPRSAAANSTILTD